MPQEGRKLFRKMATALVATLQNETRDAWELGAEAARIWPAYKRSAEDGCCEIAVVVVVVVVLCCCCWYSRSGCPCVFIC